jgi:DNA transformation protein
VKASDSEFVEFVLDQLGRPRAVSVRAMFGGHGFYLDTVFFGIAWRGRMFLKVDAGMREAFRDEGMDAFAPNERQRMESYYEVPPAVLEDAPGLKRWAARSMQLARTEKPPGRPRGRKGR